MKLSKSLFLAFAGLGLFACSNEDVVENGGIEGDASVRVHISTDALASRVGESTLETEDVEIQKITLTLTASVGGKEAGPFTSIEEANEFIFTGVRGPQKLAVSINDGKATMTLDAVQTGLAAPMFAEENITAEDYDKASKTYTVALNPEHKTAYLNFSNISHDDSEGACWFQTITFDGLFMNGVKLNEDAVSTTTYNSWAEASANTSISDAIGADWKTEGPWAGPYSYNVFPGKPILTLCYSNITVTPDRVWVDGPIKGAGYATVKDYIVSNAADLTAEEQAGLGINDEGKITEFKAGYVYNFDGLKVPDKAIGNTIIGAEDVNVVAEVSIKPWKLVDGTVTWN